MLILNHWENFGGMDTMLRTTGFDENFEVDES
jgi:hypothetical protein